MIWGNEKETRAAGEYSLPCITPPREDLQRDHTTTWKDLQRFFSAVYLWVSWFPAPLFLERHGTVGRYKVHG